jgi:hypothetical protein
MSTADRTESTPVVSDVVAACREAGLVRLVGTADGDALAAVGVLARALRGAEIPFQASVQRVPRVGCATDADATVTVGLEGGDVSLTDPVVSVPAYAAALELDAEAADPVLALAGSVAAGAVPGDDGLGLLEDAALSRRPGVAVPCADLVDGLAHSTLFHAHFSGDVAATEAALSDLDLPDGGDAEEGGDGAGAGDGSENGDLDDSARRRVASFLALSVVRDGSSRAAESVRRALRPHVGGPFETVGGFADVLDAVARERPGTGVALALGHDVGGSALEAWRTHGQRAHEALASADTGRYDGLFVVRTDGPVETVARLARDYRAPEPVTLAIGDGETAAAGDRDVTRPLRAALSTFEVETAVAGRGQSAYARLDNGIEPETLVTAFREAL